MLKLLLNHNVALPVHENWGKMDMIAMADAKRTHLPAPPSVVELVGQLPSTKSFYNDYVRPRRPVILRDKASDILGNAKLHQDLRDLPRLVTSSEEKDRTVEVNCPSNLETKGNISFSPLQDSKVIELPFTEFWKHRQSYYMTTQTLPEDEEGRPQVTNWLTDLLVSHKIVPLRPPLLGNLVPMTCANLWMGDGMSNSGLHHDFHDNLYCLLMGTKSLRLGRPDIVHHVPMVGQLETLHANGRIVYREQLGGDATIRADGALSSVDRIMDLQDRKDEIERQINTVSPEERAPLEEELDQVEDALLSIEMAHDENGVHDDEEEDEDTDLFAVQDRSKRRKPNHETKDEEEAVPDNGPLNFCTDDSAAQGAFQTVELRQGDALYLPAGWFHDVTSHGSHMALNYWYHPPDTDAPYNQPYNSPFWTRDWEARGHQLDAGTVTDDLDKEMPP